MAHKHRALLNCMLTHTCMHKLYQTYTQLFGGSWATKAGHISTAMSVIAVAQKHIQVHTSNITYTPLYLHPTLPTPYITIQTAGYSIPITKHHTLACSWQYRRLFECTVQHSSATDITTIAAQTLYCAQALHYCHNQQHGSAHRSAHIATPNSTYSNMDQHT